MFYSTDDHESSSCSSNENSSIPGKTRPKLQRHMALRQMTDNISVCSEQAANSNSIHEEPMRPRTRTNESMPALRHKRAQTVHSPLSNSEILVSNGGTSGMKRSVTSDQPSMKLKNSLRLSASNDCLSQPGSAPASLMTAPGDSDTSLSSGSKDSLTFDKQKVRRKLHIMNIFKRKQRTS